MILLQFRSKLTEAELSKVQIGPFKRVQMITIPDNVLRYLDFGLLCSLSVI